MKYNCRLFIMLISMGLPLQSMEQAKYDDHLHEFFLTDTPLGKAILAHRVDQVQALLQDGADVNAYVHTDGREDRPVHVAIKENLPAILQLLVGHNVDLTVIGDDHKTVLQLAMEQESPRMVRLLHAAGLDVTLFAYENLPRAIKLLQLAGVSPVQLNKIKKLVLCDRLSVILLRHDFAQQDYLGATALMYAAGEGDCANS